MEEISEVEYIGENLREGFLISGESDRNNDDRDTEAEYLI